MPAQGRQKQRILKKNRNRIVQKKKSHRCECPVRVESHFPVLTFQTFTVLSSLPLATDAPSGLQTTDMTLRFDEMSQHAKQLDKRRKLDKTEKKKSHGSECPVNGDPIWLPVSESQIRMEKSPFPPFHVSSPPPLTIFVPQGEKHTERTGSLCPLRVDTHVPVDVSHIFTVLS